MISNYHVPRELFLDTYWLRRLMCFDENCLYTLSLPSSQYHSPTQNIPPPLEVAAVKGHTQTVKRLLEEEADKNYQTSVSILYIHVQ